LTLQDLLTPAQVNHLNGTSVVLDHDTACAAMAEKEIGAFGGAARSEQNMAVVYISTGVGLGVTVNDQVYRGSGNASGELGHVMVNPDGEKCGCGRIGCLETEIAVPALMRKWRRKNPHHQLDTVEEIAELAFSGDQDARDLFVELGDWLGVGLSHVVNLLNPELVVIESPYFDAYELFYPTVRGKLEDSCWRFGLENLRFERTRLGSEGVALGAAISSYYALQPSATF
jgi:predicted NBD/HSP70 family sugar kinase